MSSNRGKTNIDPAEDPEEDGQVFPSKRKSALIQGVSTASLVSLQAQLFQAQQHANPTNRRPKHSTTSSRRLRLNDANTHKNKGVESRIAKDLASQPPLSPQDRLVQSQTALERKTKLYDELSKGKYQRRDNDDNDDNDDDDNDKGILEKYQVDFMMKQSDLIIHNNNNVNETHAAQVFTSNAPHFVASTRTYTEEGQQEQAPSTRTSTYDGDERVEKIESLRQIADETDRERRRIEMKRKEEEEADEKKKEELTRAYLKKQMLQKIGN